MLSKLHPEEWEPLQVLDTKPRRGEPCQPPHWTQTPSWVTGQGRQLPAPKCTPGQAIDMHSTDQLSGSSPPKWLLDSCVTNQSGGLQRARIRTSGTIRSRAASLPALRLRGPRHPDANVLKGLKSFGEWAGLGSRGHCRHRWRSRKFTALLLKTSAGNFLKIALSGHSGGPPKDKHLIQPGAGPSPTPAPAPHSLV